MEIRYKKFCTISLTGRHWLANMLPWNVKKYDTPMYVILAYLVATYYGSNIQYIKE